ncbi:MAG: thioredoxin domain-containing protein [bacterium]|jgi:hypothetical protein
MFAKSLVFTFAAIAAVLLFACPNPPEGGDSGGGVSGGGKTPAQPTVDTSAVPLADFVPNQKYLLPEGVEWLPFDAALFEKAKTEDKLIFAFKGENFDPATKNWAKLLFSDPEFAKVISENYLATWIDRDREPGVFDRYVAYKGIVPSVFLLHPTGPQVFTRTPEDQDKVIDWLNHHKKQWKEERAKYDTVAESALNEFAKVMVGAGANMAARRGKDFDAGFYDKVLEAVIATYKPDAGDFDSTTHTPEVEYVELLNDAAYRGHTGAKELLAKYFNSLFERLEDPTEGGFYTYAEGKDWQNINYGKRLDINARLACELSRYYNLTQDEKYGDAAKRTLEFIVNTLGYEASGKIVAFSNSQIADAEYFKGDAEARKGIAVPDVDPTIISEYNWKAVEALVWGHFAVDDGQGWLDIATSVANNLVANMRKDGLFARFAEDPIPEPRYLSDQVWAGRGLLTIYQATGKNEYLEAVKEVMASVKDKFTLRDAGLVDVAAGSPGLLSIAAWPADEISIAARNELLLKHLTKITGKEDSGGEHAKLAHDFISVFSGMEIPKAGTSQSSAILAIAAKEVATEPLDFHLLFANAPAGEANAAVKEVFASLFPYRSIEILNAGEDDARIAELGYTTTVPVGVFLCQGPQCVPVNPGETASKVAVIKRRLVAEGAAYAETTEAKPETA